MPMRMAGQYHDDETGLFYNYYRFYDPKTGRYVTSDLLGLADGTNPYNYVHSNPLSKVDPDGQFAFLIVNPYTIAAAGAGAGAGAVAGGVSVM